MKRPLITLVLAGILVAAIQSTAFGINLVENGDFEQVRADSSPAGWAWALARNTQAEFAFDDEERIQGSHSLKITVKDDTGQVNLMPEATAMGTPQPGASYELSVWVKTQDLRYNRFMVTPAIRFNFRPTRVRPTPLFNLMDDVGTTTDWKQLTMQITAPNDAREFILDMIITQGTVWIDGVSLTRVD